MPSELLNSSDPLDQLHPIIMPEHSVSWLPLAPGWWVLAGLLLVIPALIWWMKPRILARQLEKKLWQSSRNLLEQLYLECYSQPEITLALQNYLQSSNVIFKRAVHYFLKDPAAGSLVGEEWVEFLKKVYLPVKDGYEYLYGQQLYAKSCKENIKLEELHGWAVCWINAFQKNLHRVKSDD